MLKEGGTMKIGVIGLGLIGGSMAKALSAYTAHAVFGSDTNARVLTQALADGAIGGILDDTACAACDVLLVALYPLSLIHISEPTRPY